MICNDGEKLLRVMLAGKGFLVFLAEFPEYPDHEGHRQTCRNEKKRVEFNGLHPGDSRFRLPLCFGFIRARSNRKPVLLQQKPKVVRNGYAFHKSFVRGGGVAAGGAFAAEKASKAGAAP